MYSYDYYAYFEEHLCTAPSKLTLGSDCLGLCFHLNLGFVCPSLSATTQKANACSPRISCLFFILNFLKLDNKLKPTALYNNSYSIMQD